MTTTDIHALAVDTDTRLADLLVSIARADRNLRYTNQALKRIIGNFHSILESTPEREAKIESLNPYSQRAWRDGLAEADAYRATIRSLQDEVDALNTVWSQHRWSRFFLVTNSNGHIHSSTSCSTCRWTTDFRWLPTLSGLTEAEAVAEHGEILCSVCFPSAPVEWTTGESKASKEAKAERAAAKTEREAKRLAKALLPDGSTLVVLISEQGWNGRPRVEEITTAAAAKSWLTNAAEWRSVDGKDHPSYPSSAEAVIAEALAAKNGTTAEAEIAAAKQRAAKRR